MLVFIIRRLMQAVLVLAVMSVLVFVGIYLIGDPLAILARPEATELDREAIAHALGLDLPLWQQYLTFLAKALTGDFGTPFVLGHPAMHLILSDERRVGNGGVGPCSLRVSLEHLKKKHII